MAEDTCSHLNAITKVKHPTRRECQECVKIGASWVHLRTCQTCGVTLCCDDSPNRHATKHAHASGHPVIASAEPGERWLYCYPDDAFCGVLDFAKLIARSHMNEFGKSIQQLFELRSNADIRALKLRKTLPDVLRLEDGAKMVAVGVDTKPAEAIP